MRYYMDIAFFCILAGLVSPPFARANGKLPFPDQLPDEHAVGFEEREAEDYAGQIDGWTTLTFAVLKGDRPLAERCLKMGANINEKDRFNRSPLLLATEYNCGEMIRFLVDHGADINTTGPQGRTPLMAAIDQGKESPAKFLLSRGANPEIFNKGITGTNFRFNALQLAAALGTPDLVQLLLDHGAAVQATNMFGQTALHLAAALGRANNARLLIERGADVNSRYTGAPPRNPLDLFQAAPNQGYVGQERRNWTPLNEAVVHSHVEMIRLLAEKGARVNDPDGQGLTPLCYAVVSGNLRAVRELLRFHADVNVKTPRGETPLDLASRPPATPEIADMLRRAGARPGDRLTTATLPRRLPGPPAGPRKVVFESPGFTTASTAQLAATLQYRLEIRPPRSSYDDDRYELLLQGCPERIPLNDASDGSRKVIPADIKLAWLEPARLLDVKWREIVPGTAAAQIECHTIVRVAAHHASSILRDVQELSSHSGSVSARKGSTHIEWYAKSSELVLIHYDQDGDWYRNPWFLVQPVPDHQGYPYLNFQYLKSVWRYRLENDKLVPVQSGKYLIGANGRPSIDVAYKYGINLSRLKILNRSLKSQIFCDRMILLKDNLDPPSATSPW